MGNPEKGEDQNDGFNIQFSEVTSRIRDSEMRGNVYAEGQEKLG